MTRIVILAPRDPRGIGGVEKLVKEFSVRLKNRYDVHIICSGKRGAYSLSGIPVYLLKGYFDGYAFVTGAAELIKKLNPSIIYAHNYSTYMPYLASRIKTHSNEKFVLHAHFHPTGASAFTNLARRVYDPVFGRTVMKSADVIISNSKSERDWIKRKFGDKENIRTIYNGIDVAAIHSANSIELDRAIRKILFVGRFEPYKHADVAIKAISLLPETFHLFLIGEGRQRKYLEQLALSTNCQNRVHFLGYLQDQEVYMWYKTANLLLHPSESESFGMTCLEALAAGIPSLANQDNFGLSETTGLFPNSIFPFNIKKQSIKELSVLIQHFSDVKPMSVDLASFDWNSLVHELSEIFDSLCP